MLAREEQEEQLEYTPTAEEIESIIKETNIRGYQDRIASLSSAITWGVLLERGNGLEYEYALGESARKRLEELIIILAEDMVGI